MMMSELQRMSIRDGNPKSTLKQKHQGKVILTKKIVHYVREIISLIPGTRIAISILNPKVVPWLL